jgi:hypothetical protein
MGGGDRGLRGKESLQGVWLAGLFLDGGCGFDEFH